MQTERHPQLGAFSIEEKIGEGGMGVVYRAFDPDLQRTVAIKRIHPRLTGQKDLADRFVSEARAIAAVTHANIAQIHAIHARDSDTPPFFVMEFVEGESAESRVQRIGALSVSEAIDIVAQAARGLRAAHQRGIVHGDVKPSNLVITGRGLVKLVDFGLSRPISDLGGSAGNSALGTPHYVSPEQSKRHAIDHRSDIYSLGCTLFFLLTGRPPFDGDTQKEVLQAHRERPAPDIRTVRAEVPAPMAELLSRMLAKSPGARSIDYDQLLQELEQCRVRDEGEPPEATPSSAPTRMSWLRSATWILLWSCTLTLAGIVATTKSETVRRWIGISPGPETLARSLLEGVATTNHDGRDVLTYDFSDVEEIHPSVKYSQQTGKPPMILEGQAMEWRDYTQPIDFPYLSEIDELELRGVLFTGTPDFEIRLGVDDARMGNYVKFTVRVDDNPQSPSDRSHSTYSVNPIEVYIDGDRQSVDLGSPATMRFVIAPLKNYVIRLKRETTAGGELPAETAKFLLTIAEGAPEKTKFEASFLVPNAAIGAGYVRLRSEAMVNSGSWSVQIKRVSIRGRVDYGRVSQDMRAKGGRR